MTDDHEAGQIRLSLVDRPWHECHCPSLPEPRTAGELVSSLARHPQNDVLPFLLDQLLADPLAQPAGRQTSGFPCPVCGESDLAEVLDEQLSMRRMLLACPYCRTSWWVETGC